MSTPPAALSVLRMIRFLAEHTGPVQAATIARELDLPRSSVYQLLRALLDEGFVLHFPEERAYALSPLITELGTSSDRVQRLQRLGRPLLRKLIKRVQHPVVAQLGILHGADVVYAAKESAPRGPAIVSGVGVRLPAHLTATGRAILAELDHAQVRALFPSRGSLTRRSDAGPETLGELDRILRDTRDRGWATEVEEVTPGYASVAVAALDHNGYPAAAVTLTYRTAAMDEGTAAELGAAVVVTAGALSMRLQGRI